MPRRTKKQSNTAQLSSALTRALNLNTANLTTKRKKQRGRATKKQNVSGTMVHDGNQFFLALSINHARHILRGEKALHNFGMGDDAWRVDLHTHWRITVPAGVTAIALLVSPTTVNNMVMAVAISITESNRTDSFVTILGNSAAVTTASNVSVYNPNTSAAPGFMFSVAPKAQKDIWWANVGANPGVSGRVELTELTATQVNPAVNTGGTGYSFVSQSHSDQYNRSYDEILASVSTNRHYFRNPGDHFTTALSAINAREREFAGPSPYNESNASDDKRINLAITYPLSDGQLPRSADIVKIVAGAENDYLLGGAPMVVILDNVSVTGSTTYQIKVRQCLSYTGSGVATVSPSVRPAGLEQIQRAIAKASSAGETNTDWVVSAQRFLRDAMSVTGEYSGAFTSAYIRGLANRGTSSTMRMIGS